MSGTSLQPVTTAKFDSSATYEPTVGPGTVLISGSAINATNIANIEIFDDGTALGGTGSFQSSNSGWSFVATLTPGKHVLSATVTELSGATYSIDSPYELVTGIQNQAYVFQELDENSAGVVSQISSYDGSGTLVSQMAVAVNGGSASPFSVAFDPTATFAGPTETLLSGTNLASGAAASIEIFDGTAGNVVDPKTGAVLSSAKALGYATINDDGSWSFDAHISAGTHQFTAVATSKVGQTAVSQSAFTIVAGVVGAPYVYEEIDRGLNGEMAATTSYGADGSIVGRSNGGGLTIKGGVSTGEVRRSLHNDVFSGDGTGATTFVFTHGFGQDEITDFHATQSPAGIEHDVISLPHGVFQTVAQILQHTTSALDGDAVIHLSRTDTIKLDGVTKADLVTHPDVFRFHS